MSDPRNRQYTNGDITVFWVPSKCIHATTCFRELIEVFNPGRRPWVNMEGAASRRIIEVVNKCPTQALIYKYNKDLSKAELARQFKPGTPEVTPANLGSDPASEAVAETKPAEVRVMPDGPIVVEGDFRVIGDDGQELKDSIMTSFCRCGASRSMPYCDGTHRKTDFSDQ